MIRHLLRALLVLLAATVPAQAAPIVVSAGQTVTFDFDFTGVVAPPPYSGAVGFFPGIDPLDVGDDGTWTGYEGPNATGAIFFSFNLSLNVLAAAIPSVQDGIFSVVLSMTSGSVTVDPFAVATDASSGQPITGNVFPQPQSAAVPEPATLTLLGGGLAAAALRRRRRMRQTA